MFAASQPPASAAVIASQVLLHHEQAGIAWRIWAKEQGIEERRTLAGPTFAQYSAVIQAAVSGLGVGLVPRVLVEDELAHGLVLAYGDCLEVDHGHYLCYQADRLDRPVFSAFRDWLLTQGILR